MSGDAGARLILPKMADADEERFIRALFNEELGLVLELRQENADKVRRLLQEQHVPHSIIGASTHQRELVIQNKKGTEVLLRERIDVLRQEWQATSIKLEKLQTNPACIEAEEM